MIVRDEAAVIERCLDSVRPIIDTWTICDTGSVDATPELIQRALAEVPGTLHHRRWRDFGANRTELAELSRGTADYLLLIDADMTLVRNGPLPELSADAYLVRHLGALEYVVPRLVRGDRRWWFEGATHEHLATEGPYTQEALDALAIEHHGDGSSRGEKFERDVRLLEAAISRDPADVRATFYLAQTLREGGEEDRAIELYRRRVELGGWDEEVFYAAFQLGALVGHGDPDAAIALLLDAHERRPQRAEPLQELARLSRLRGRYRAAHLFARRAAELELPGDLLFVHRDVYEWGARFEQAVAAYWIGEHEEALAVNDALLAEGRMPPAHMAVAEANRRRCLEALGRPVFEPPRANELTSLAPGLKRGEVRLEVEPAWPQFNPTIAPNGHGFLLGVRTANYRIVNGAYEVLDADGVIRTVNYLARLDGALRVESTDPIEDLADDAPFHPTPVQGWEDLRLIEVDRRWFAIANARDVNPQARAEVALLELDGPRIVAAHVLEGPDPNRHEKNWMPFVRDGRLHLVYSCGPTVVYEYDLASGVLEVVAQNDAPHFARELRGGSQGVRVQGGWLFAVHEAFDGPAGRSYVQRLALLDDELRLSRLSPRFSFDGQPIEICHGLALAEERLIFSYGVGDHTARLGVCPLAEALAILQPAT